MLAADGRRLLVTSDRAADADVEAVSDIGVEVLRYPYGEGLRGALGALGNAGMTRVLVEAGPGLFTAAYDARAIDELVCFHAGGVAGNAAPAAYLAQGAESEGCLVGVLGAVEAGVAGDDAVTVWRPRAA